MPPLFSYRGLLLVLCGVLTVGCQAQSQTDQPAVAPEDGRPHATANDLVFPDTVWLDNGKIKLGVSPSVGRITWFGFSDGDNLLWINPDTINAPPDDAPDNWVNYGGDKVWIGPQPLWPYFLPHGNNWPPDPAVDGLPWKLAEANENKIIVRSPHSDVSGTDITRIIEIGKNSSVVIRNEIKRISISAMPIQAWSVSQIKRPEQVWMPGIWQPQSNHGNRPRHEAWVGLMDTEKFENELSLTHGTLVWKDKRNPTGKKLGALGRTMIATYGLTVFRQDHEIQIDGSYPERSSIQFYVGEDYAELELLSPVHNLGLGTTSTHTVIWNLQELQPESEVSETSDPNSLQGYFMYFSERGIAANLADLAILKSKRESLKNSPTSTATDPAP